MLDNNEVSHFYIFILGKIVFEITYNQSVKHDSQKLINNNTIII